MCPTLCCRYTDGTLAPEAEWGTLINQSLCDATNRMGTMIRNTMLDKDATCVPPSAQYIRSYYSIGYPLPGYNGMSISSSSISSTASPPSHPHTLSPSLLLHTHRHVPMDRAVRRRTQRILSRHAPRPQRRAEPELGDRCWRALLRVLAIGLEDAFDHVVFEDRSRMDGGDDG